MISRILKHALDALLPQHCLVCARIIRSHRQICSACTPTSSPQLEARCGCCFSRTLISQVKCEVCRLLPPPFRRCRYLWDYKESYKDFIVSMKYKPSRKLCVLAGDILAANLSQLFSEKDWDLIVPVACSREGFRKRGFNQCSLIAGRLAKTALPSIKVASFALQRQRDSLPQASLAHAKRLTNSKGAFIAKRRLVAGRRILLLDDVMTTGASCFAACKSLREAGAAEIDILLLSRSENWLDFRNIVTRSHSLSASEIVNEKPPR